MLQHAATHCNTLQRTATHCNTLQHKRGDAPTCATWSYDVYPHARCSVLQCVVVAMTHMMSSHRASLHRNTLQHTATHCNTQQRTATHCNTKEMTHPRVRHDLIMFIHMRGVTFFHMCDMTYSLHWICCQVSSGAVCCSVLQCGAVCCSVLQYFWLSGFEWCSGLCLCWYVNVLCVSTSCVCVCVCVCVRMRVRVRVRVHVHVRVCVVCLANPCLWPPLHSHVWCDSHSHLWHHIFGALNLFWGLNWCVVVQCSLVCCSVLQCVAVCCSVKLLVVRWIVCLCVNVVSVSPSHLGVYLCVHRWVSGGVVVWGGFG